MANTIIPYDRHLKQLARELRNHPTEAEAVLWSKIRRKALKVEFHRQVPLLSYIVDFYCHEIGLAIEVDGSIHEHQILEDAGRQDDLEQRGIHFLRFTNEQIFYSMDEVLKIISEDIKKCL